MEKNSNLTVTKSAIYPGTFDPITFGHIDIINRASTIFNNILIAVVKHPTKNCMFSFDDRVRFVREATSGFPGIIEVDGFEGLIVDYAVRRKIGVIIRGLRMISDFEYEFQMALTNRKLKPQVETLFLMPHPNYSYLSSRLVKEIAALGGDLHDFLPPCCIESLEKKFRRGG